MIIIGNLNSLVYPLTFEPIFKDYIWGGNKLHRFIKKLPEGRIAESWEASCHPKGTSIISNGPLKNESLLSVINSLGSKIVGTYLENRAYPLLIKFIDSKEKLSVQVHPSDQYALINEKSSGKNEMWYIISSEPDSYIYYGLKKGTTKSTLKKAIQEGTIEKHLNKMYVYPGDAIYISAGTVHAIGGGILLAEIQQNSDITYRIFDYNRKDNSGNPLRELHIEKALDVIDFGKTEYKKLEGFHMGLGKNSKKILLIKNNYFSCEFWNVSETLFLKSTPDTFSIFTILEGSLRIYHKFGITSVNTGESVLIPSALSKFIFEGRYKALKSYVPYAEFSDAPS